MTLIDRMKPEFKEVLQSKNQKHPDLVSRVSDSLETYSYVADLPYGIVLNIMFLFDTNFVYPLFNESV